MDQPTIHSPALNYSEIFSRAWENVSGSKLPYFIALVMIVAVYIFLAIVRGVIFGFETLEDNSLSTGSFLMSLAESTISTIFMAGLLLMAIRRARGQTISAGMIFDAFPRFLPLVITWILMTVILMIGFMLLIIPGIYLSVCYIFAVPLVAERELNPWPAMELSRKVITKHWFSYLGLLLVVGIAQMIAAIPLLIGLIWAFPWGMNVMGELYVRAFDGNSTVVEG